MFHRPQQAEGLSALLNLHPEGDEAPEGQAGSVRATAFANR
jgi:hypothetical protein